MANLESILNVLIPGGVIIFVIGLMYMKLKVPIDSFFVWIKNMIISSKEKAEESLMLTPEIIYT